MSTEPATTPSVSPWLRATEVACLLTLAVYCLLAPRVIYLDLPLFLVACLTVAFLGSREAVPPAPAPARARLALAVLAGFTALGVLGMGVYGYSAPRRLGVEVALRVGVVYVLYAYLQQYLTQRYLAVRVRGWLGAPAPWKVALAVALLFGVAHLPWPELILPTVLTGFVWSWCYLQVGRVWPIAASHVLLAVAFFSLVLGRDPFVAVFG